VSLRLLYLIFARVRLVLWSWARAVHRLKDRELLRLPRVSCADAGPIPGPRLYWADGGPPTLSILRRATAVGGAPSGHPRHWGWGVCLSLAPPPGHPQLDLPQPDILPPVSAVYRRF